MARLVPFLNGATAALAFVSALFFFRFWQRTSDRFFAIFGLAFVVLGANWAALSLVSPESEFRALFYVARACAFVLIIAAIVDKNRTGSS